MPTNDDLLQNLAGSLIEHKADDDRLTDHDLIVHLRLRARAEQDGVLAIIAARLETLSVADAQHRQADAERRRLAFDDPPEEHGAFPCGRRLCARCS